MGEYDDTLEKRLDRMERTMAEFMATTSSLLKKKVAPEIKQPIIHQPGFSLEDIANLKKIFTESNEKSEERVENIIAKAKKEAKEEQEKLEKIKDELREEIEITVEAVNEAYADENLGQASNGKDQMLTSLITFVQMLDIEGITKALGINTPIFKIPPQGPQQLTQEDIATIEGTQDEGAVEDG